MKPTGADVKNNTQNLKSHIFFSSVFCTIWDDQCNFLKEDKHLILTSCKFNHEIQEMKAREHAWFSALQFWLLENYAVLELSVL